MSNAIDYERSHTVTPQQDHNPNIQVEITDASEFHCFRLVLNSQSEPGQRIEVMFHARSLVDLIHKCSVALSDWQKQTTEYLLERAGITAPSRSLEQVGRLADAAGETKK